MPLSKIILLVEDDITLSQSLKDYLVQSGFTVITAADGKDALDMVAQNRPDLILLDLVLPRMDGVSFIKELHKDESLASTPIIVLTNNDDLESIGQTLDTGVIDYLVKHEWKLEDITGKIRQRLGMEAA